jgi:hypothetical protein
MNYRHAFLPPIAKGLGPTSEVLLFYLPLPRDWDQPLKFTNYLISCQFTTQNVDKSPKLGAPKPKMLTRAQSSVHHQLSETRMCGGNPIPVHQNPQLEPQVLQISREGIYETHGICSHKFHKKGAPSSQL